MSLARQFRAAEAPKAAKPVTRKSRVPEPAKEIGSEIPIVSGKKRGPKPSADTKVLLTLRLKPSTIERFKATGKGWQARMSDALDTAAEK